MFSLLPVVPVHLDVREIRVIFEFRCEKLKTNVSFNSTEMVFPNLIEANLITFF